MRKLVAAALTLVLVSGPVFGQSPAEIRTSVAQIAELQRYFRENPEAVIAVAAASGAIGVGVVGVAAHAQAVAQQRALKALLSATDLGMPGEEYPWGAVREIRWQSPFSVRVEFEEPPFRNRWVREFQLHEETWNLGSEISERALRWSRVKTVSVWTLGVITAGMLGLLILAILDREEKGVTDADVRARRVEMALAFDVDSGIPPASLVALLQDPALRETIAAASTLVRQGYLVVESSN